MKKVSIVKKSRMELFLENCWTHDEPAPPELIENIRKHYLDTNQDPNEIIEMEYEVFKCSICGRTIDDSFSNNAQPINRGRCCNRCNSEVVIPARISRMRRGLSAY